MNTESLNFNYTVLKEKNGDSCCIALSGKICTPYMFSESFALQLSEKFSRLSLSPVHIADVISDYINQYIPR